MNYRYPKYFATCYQYWLADHGLPPVLAVMYKWIFYQMIPTSEKSLQNGDSVSKWWKFSVDLCILIWLYYIILCYIILYYILEVPKLYLKFHGENPCYQCRTVTSSLATEPWILALRPTHSELWWINHP